MTCLIRFSISAAACLLLSGQARGQFQVTDSAAKITQLTKRIVESMHGKGELV